MYPVDVVQFELSVDSTLSKAVSFTRLDPEKLGPTLLDAFELQGLTPDGLTVRRNDALYDYQVRFGLFRGSASFSISAKAIRAEFVNGRTPADLNTMIEVLTRFYGCLNLPEGTFHNIRATSQFAFESPARFVEYFAAARGLLWESTEAVGYTVFLDVPGWQNAVRLSLEPSMSVPDGGFVVLSTQHHEAALTAQVASQVDDAFAQALVRGQLELRMKS